MLGDHVKDMRGRLGHRKILARQWVQDDSQLQPAQFELGIKLTEL